MRRLAFGCVLLLCTLHGSCQQAERLSLGRATVVSLAPGQSASFDLSLTAQDFVTYDVDPNGSSLIAYVFDPAGVRLRGERIEEKGTYGFAAAAAGLYRVQLIAEKTGDKAARPLIKPLPVSITVSKIIPLAQRLAMLATKPMPESPRIKELTASLDAGHSGAVDLFWREMKTTGTPLVEPLAGNDQMMLVTFLWRGAAGLKGVFVDTALARNAPDDFRMQKLRDSDVWYVSVPLPRSKRLMYRLMPNAPYIGPPAERSEDEENLFSIIADATGELDPLNPKRSWIDPRNIEAERYSGKSVLEMPSAPIRPWLVRKPGTPLGKIELIDFSSALGEKRTVRVYMPPAYTRTAKPYPVLFFTDGEVYQDKLGLPATLDNLIESRRIPPVVAVMIDNVAGQREHDLACDPRFSYLLNSELVPRIRRGYNVTTDPRQTVIGGYSLGGLTAGCTALRHPETFGNVLAQSGSFWWTPTTPPNDTHPPTGVEPNWLAKQFLASPRLATRFYLSAGSDEIDVSGRGADITLTSRHLRDVLLAKGYPVAYVEIAGDHDVLNWETTLPDGLLFLLGNPPADSGKPVKKP
jgi:enterochelin esterase-like enzyme